METTTKLEIWRCLEKAQAEGPGGEEEGGYKVFTESWNHGKLSKQSGKVMKFFSLLKSHGIFISCILENSIWLLGHSLEVLEEALV